MGKQSSLEHIILVETTLGNSFTGRSTPCLVHLGAGNYLQCTGADLRKGDHVLFHKEGIHKKAEEVYPILLESERYKSAFDIVYIHDDLGHTIPSLRHDLYVGLGDRADIMVCERLQDLFKVEGADFSPGEYARLGVFIQDYLTRHPFIQHRYHEGTIEDWLSGETKAPKDFRVFAALAEQFPLFEKYVCSDKFETNYKLYVVIRQGVMRMLSYGIGMGQASQQKNETEGISISLAEEIRIVLNQFMEDIDEHYMVGLVTKVRKVDPTRQGKSRPSSTLCLSKGLASPEEAKNVGKRVDFRVLIDHSNALQAGLILGLMEYAIKVPNDPLVHKIREGDKKFGDKDPFNTATGLFEMMSERRTYYRGKEFNSTHWPELRRHILEKYREFYMKMGSGEIDMPLALPHGTMYQALVTWRSLTSKIPDEIAVYEWARHIIQDKRGVVGKPGVEMGKSLRRKFGYDPNKPFKSVLTNFFNFDENLETAVHGYQTLQDRTVMIQLANQFGYEGDQKTLLTKQEVSDILTVYQVDGLIRFFHPNLFCQGQKTIFD